jgi:hypothetical protein
LPIGLAVTTIAGQRNTALQRLAENIGLADSAAVRGLLQKSWATLTLAGGDVAKPTDALTAALPNARIILSDGGANVWPEPAEWVGTVFDLFNPPPLRDYIFFTHHAGLLRFRQYTADGIVTPTLNGVDLNKADVTGSYIPPLADIALTDDVADVLFDTAVALFNESPMASAAEAKVNA